MQLHYGIILYICRDALEFVWGNSGAVTMLTPNCMNLPWGTALSIMRSVWGKSQPGSKPPRQEVRICIAHTHQCTHRCVIDVLMTDEKQLTLGDCPLVYVTCNGFTSNWASFFILQIKVRFSAPINLKLMNIYVSCSNAISNTLTVSLYF